VKPLHTRLPEELHRWLKVQAAKEGTTVQALIQEAVELLKKQREQK